RAVAAALGTVDIQLAAGHLQVAVHVHAVAGGVHGNDAAADAHGARGGGEPVAAETARRAEYAFVRGGGVIASGSVDAVIAGGDGDLSTGESYIGTLQALVGAGHGDGPAG